MLAQRWTLNICVFSLLEQSPIFQPRLLCISAYLCNHIYRCIVYFLWLASSEALMLLSCGICLWLLGNASQGDARSYAISLHTGSHMVPRWWVALVCQLLNAATFILPCFGYFSRYQEYLSVLGLQEAVMSCAWMKDCYFALEHARDHTLDEHLQTDKRQHDFRR